MARARSPNRNKAFKIYEEHNGNITNREIANILNISEKTISGWKCKDKWNDELNGVLLKNERSTPKEKKNTKIKNKEPIVKEVEEVLENTELTDKQRLFCIYYIKSFNATKAYKKAYECDYITANTNGPRLLVNACIKKEIQKLKEGRLNRAMLEPGDIFQKFMDIAFADITDYITFGRKEIEVDKNEDGESVMSEVNYVDFKNSNEVDGTILNEVSQGKNGIKIKLNDQIKALQWLGEHMDLATQEQKLRIEKLKAEVSKLNGDDKNKQKGNLGKLLEVFKKGPAK
ncbi:terminase small subunit [Clostridium botulinum]|uniref:terminase small subunit n=1 Tax=Clostridium botulinum TaxID=1491 RepID=UPI0005BD422C|nr:terminase small subunit [Clostridium botulinum]